MSNVILFSISPRAWHMLCAMFFSCAVFFVYSAYLHAAEKPPVVDKSWILAEPVPASAEPENIEIAAWLPGVSQGHIVALQGGAEVPYLLLHRGKDDFVSLLVSTRDTSKLSFSFKPGKNPQMDNKWFPDYGLLLRTYRYPGGAADNLEQMRQMLQKCKNDNLQYGAGMVSSVFHGCNLYGQSDSYVSEYRGRIYCPVDGEYTFATSSDDASFLLVDGKEVVSWPGGHGPVGDTRYNKKISMKKGWHGFEYLHVNFTGGACAVAAWKKPGEKKILPIPAEVFGKPARRFTKLKYKNGKPLIWVKNLGESWIGEHQLLRWGYSLSDGSVADFNTGDGIETRSREVEQIYLQPGLRTVVARKDGNEYRVLVDIEPDYSRQVERAVDRPKKYWQQIARMPYAKLSTPELAVAVSLLQENGSYPQQLADAAGELLMRQKQGNGDAEERIRVLLLLAKVLREELDKPQESALLLRRELEGRLPDSLRADVSRELGDTLFYYLNDLDGALNQYDMVVGRYGGILKGNTARVTQIKIGDIYRQKKMSVKAREAYRLAQAMGQEDKSPMEGKYRRGGLYRAADDFLRRDELEPAREWVELLEWEFPLEKLDGYSSILRARIALKNKNFAEAAKQLSWFIGASPDSNYASTAAQLLSGVLRGMGDVSGAVDVEKKYGLQPGKKDID